MFLTVLDQKQQALLPFLATFAKEYCLVGGTAIALLIGHRRSIDFDLFTLKPVQRLKIRNLIHQAGLRIEQVLYEEEGQLHLIANEVKLTFFQYPYSLERVHRLPNGLYLPSLLTLAAMKALALGGRAKWKDYVDLYFILRDHHSLNEVCAQAHMLFQESFSEKLLREQLCFFDDIDFSEQIDYLVPDPGEQIIQNALVHVATGPWQEE